MSALFIPGQAAPHTPLLHDKFIQVEALQSITTDSRRSGAETHELDEAGDVVLLEFEGGIQQWILREEIEEVLGVESSRGSERVLSLRRRRKSGRRGVKDWVLKGLKVFKVDLKGVAAEAVAKIVDRKMCSEPGLMQGFPKPGQLGPAQTNLPTDNPLLLFIHGTFSNSVLGYAGLTEPEQAGAWKALTDQYSHAPLFFNHPTFSKSPVENALDLVEQLPKSARLHLVSHSRGGLVGDLLCLGDEKAQEHLTSEVLGTVPRLDELCRLLKEKQIVVEKFVRVACPARGTLLASERLDVYLNVILNLVTRMTGLNGPYSTLIRSFLLAVIRRRNDASRIPGIEAMVPGSPLVKLLNGLPVSLGSELTVLAGDVEGAGFAGNLKVFTADSFFLEDHDLVVDTKSMYGGLKRDQSFFYFRSGSDVDHLNYFRTPDFVDALRRGLGDLTAAPVNLRPLTAGRRGLFSRPLSKPTGARPGVFILPGIMGSHLQLGQNRIWLDPFSLGIGGFRKLDNFEEVSSEAVVDSHYGDLARYLDKTHDVYLWHYDWRISVLENGRRLAKDMKAALRKSASSQQSLGIIAHSMGGLVVRAMLAQKPEVWDEACKRPNSRIVFLGTPHSGSLQILRVLSGDENIVRGLYAVDMFGSRADYTSLLGKFPGVVQLLPSEHGQHDFSKLQTWKKLQNADGHLTIPPNSVRDEASALWDKLNNNDLWQRDNVTYVAGWARSTPSNIKVENGKLKFFSTGRGDGRVLWAGGVLEDDKKNYYAQVSHGKLPDFRKAFSGYKDLLERGETSHALLSKQPPVGLRGDDREWEEVDRPLAIHPEESDLMAFAMGDDDEGPRDASLPELPLNVRVVHGDLTFARYPVMLGHYSDDVIVGAEGVLDRHLNGALRLRRMKGVYPGTEGTTLVLLRPESDVPGAIIIGLGDVGNLSAGSLGQALERGVKEYVMRLSEEERTDTPQELGITTILIGSGESGIPLSESLSTLIESVLTANRSLRGTDGTESRVIQRLDVIELYEDVATEAAHLLRMLQSEPRFSGRLEIETQLQTSPGRLRRAYSVTDSGWWRRLQVKTRENGPGLIYQTFLERARAESYEVGVGQDAIEQFTRTVETDPNYRPEISVTLFELMVPNQVKYLRLADTTFSSNSTRKRQVCLGNVA